MSIRPARRCCDPGSCTSVGDAAFITDDSSTRPPTGEHPDDPDNEAEPRSALVQCSVTVSGHDQGAGEGMTPNEPVAASEAAVAQATPGEPTASIEPVSASEAELARAKPGEPAGAALARARVFRAMFGNESAVAGF